MLPFNLFDTLHATPPVHPILRPLLDSGSQFSLVQIEIIHGADTQDTLAREGPTDTIHERAACRAKVVSHLVAQATVCDWVKVLWLSRPRRCLRYVSSTVKLEANMDAVILWQSEQLQINVSSRPGPLVGWRVGDGVYKI